MSPWFCWWWGFAVSVHMVLCVCTVCVVGTWGLSPSLLLLSGLCVGCHSGWAYREGCCCPQFSGLGFPQSCTGGRGHPIAWLSQKPHQKVSDVLPEMVFLVTPSPSKVPASPALAHPRTPKLGSKEWTANNPGSGQALLRSPRSTPFTELGA